MNDNIQNNNPTTTEDSTNSTVRILITIVVLLIVASIGGFIWLVSQGSSIFNLNNNTLTDITYSPSGGTTSTAQDTLTLFSDSTTSTVQDMPTSFGELYLTLTPKSTGATNGYIYDFKTNTMRSAISDLNINNNLYIFHTFNKSGTKSTYLTSSNNNTEKPFRLYFKDSVSNREQLVANLSEPPMSGAVISPNGEQILYTARASGKAGVTIPKAGDLGIILASRKSDGTWSSKRLWGGSSPQWITDETFYFLKNDGIYLGNIKQNTKYHVRKTTGVLDSNSRLSISNDGKSIVWTLPDVGKVIILSDTYDKTLGIYTLEKIRTIYASAFWSSFSPDNTKIAIQSVDFDTLETNPNSRIEIYSVSTGGRVLQDIDLNNYDQSSMFLTDWR